MSTSDSSTANRIPPGRAPVELRHAENVPTQSFLFYEGSRANYRLLLDKDDLVALLFLLEPGQAIPPHVHDVDKAIHVYAGVAAISFDEETKELAKSDSVFVPARSAIGLKNSNDHACRLLFFFPSGPFESLAFRKPADKSQCGPARIQHVRADSVAWENWDGPLLRPEDSPLAWRTLIDNDQMVLGVTKIDPGQDVDSHYHRQTQIILFSGGEGKTHIQDGRYERVRELSFIYPPPYCIHHSINPSRTDPLLEVYFFPSGPFSSVEYLFDRAQ